MVQKRRFDLLRVSSLVLGTSLVFLATFDLRGAQNSMIALVTDRQIGAAARHGANKVQLALQEKGIRVEQTTSLELARGNALLVVGISTGSGAAARVHKERDIPAQREAESLSIRRTSWAGKKVLLVSGADDRGLMYALLDVADRIGWGSDPSDPFSEVRDIQEKPAVAERALSIYTMHQGNFESYFYDESYWAEYLDMLAKNRFNTFALLFGYENWGYFSPPYPYFFDVEEFGEVKVVGITKEKQRRNLDALNRIIRMTHERGLNFTLGIWDHIYRGGVQGPGDRAGKPTEGIVWGLTADNLTAYTRAALTKFLKLVPEIDAIQFRMHGESGLKRTEMGGFWENVYQVMKEHGPNIRFDARAKNFPDSLIDKAVEMGVNMRICTKYWMEQHVYRTVIPGSDVREGLNYLIEAVDRNGQRVRTDMITVTVTDDKAPPLLKHTPIASALAGNAIVVAAEVSDPSGVRWVRLRYRSVTQFQDYKTLEMTGTSRKGKYRAVVPGGDVEAKWDFMYLFEVMDNALWDIRGKHFGVPVYRLLGGPTRERVRAYASMLGYSVEPDNAGEVAREYFDRGFTAQKWFFKHNPADGGGDRRKNLELVRVLRETLGDEAELMFDCKWSWDVPYAISMAREMLPYRPTWLEEPLHPEQLEGYIRIKRETGIPLAAGEHFYTRWNVKPFLDAGVLDFVQTDPEWCGGITELVKICALAEAYDVKVVPHGHHILAAAHVVAAQPPSVCPMVEYLFHSHLDRMQYCHKTILRPERGSLSLPLEPGLGLALDEEKIGERSELKWD